MIREGLEARLSCIDQRFLPAAFAGRSFDDALLRDLPEGVDPCGERGEFHSCVVSGPMFERALEVEAGEVVVRGDFVFADVRLKNGRNT